MNIDTNRENITTREFVTILIDNVGNNELTKEVDIMNFAKKSQIIESYDMLKLDENIERKRAAIITHNFMKKICGIKDIEDISPAEVMKDLYDCRVYANAIAQVFLRDMLNAYEYLTDENSGRSILLFEKEKELKREEAFRIVRTIKSILLERR